MDANSLHHKASEETLTSLLHLDPSPIDSQAANMDKSLSQTPGDRAGTDPEKSRLEPADTAARPHRGTTGPISFRASAPALSSTRDPDSRADKS